MLISKYSAPDFDPYGDNRSEEPPTLWPAPVASGPVTASISLPGSKSLTARELVLSALADKPSLLRAPLHSRDTTNMAEALRALGVGIQERPGESAFGADLLVTPPEELVGSTTIECGQAGTVMRFVPPVAGLALGPTMFNADTSARGRPMGAIIAALRALGVDVNDDSRNALPFTVHGTGSITGGTIEVDASSSSQFISALLLSASRFEEGLDLTHSGAALPSLPHIEMTIATLAARGVTVESPTANRWIVRPGAIRARDIDIEPDLSNAAPFLAAAVVTGGSVTITGWPGSTTQVGADLTELLPLFGATVAHHGDRLTVTGPERISGIQLDLTTGGELAPAIVAIAALADEPSEITGIGHIRHHETDRLAALATELNGLGGAVTERHDSLLIEPRTLTGGVWHSYDDHRMAMAGAILGLAIPGVQIENIATTAKTLPPFPQLWARMLSEGTAV